MIDELSHEELRFAVRALLGLLGVMSVSVFAAFIWLLA
jgi:hypothetical protein